MNNPYFDKLDLQFLKLFVFPYLKNQLASVKPSLRLSPGDLAARNILVNNNKDLRIIDLEFSYETHFHHGDWFRLTIFSSTKFQQIPFVQEIIEQNNPSIEIYSYLRQTFLNRFVHLNEEYEHYTCEDLYRIINYIEKHTSETIGSSLLIRGITNTFKKSLNDISDERNLRLSKETELETQTLLRIQRENELDSEKQIRIQRENELDSEKQLRIKKENELDSEKQLRIKKENELDSEKQLKIKKENELDSEKQLRILKESDLIIKNNKVYRMQNSFSWKLTQPFRFLRRMLVDPFRLRDSSKNKKNSNTNSYQDWIKHFDTLDNDKISVLKGLNDSLRKKPLISIVMPVFNPPKLYFEEAIQSVIDQLYENWELCIADDMSTAMYVREIIERYSTKYPQIKAHFNEQHGHISKTSNNALKLATGQFVVLMDHDDLLRPHSLLRFAEVHNCKPNAKIIYSDEDKIDESNNRFQPYFKPDWNPDLLLGQNYICHLACIKKDLIEEIGSFRVGYEGSQDWDLFLRVTEKLKPDEISHIPEILYHWRSYFASTASSLGNKEYAIGGAKKTLKDYIERNEIKAKILNLNERGNYWKIRYEIPQKKPLVSIIIPTKNQKEILKVCIESILSKTDYSNYEILIIDNDTTEPESKLYLENLNKKNGIEVIKISGEFNYSRLNNKAVERAKGEVLLLLNNDIEVLYEDWLDIMVSHAIRPEIGCVGAKLLYPNSTIQHAGVVLGIGGVAGHPYKGFSADSPGQFSRLLLTQNFEAVTGACMAIKKSIYEEVGGLNEKDLKVAFNDVDFCLRIKGLGYKNTLDPSVILFHHESYSRGLDTIGQKKARFDKEVEYMCRKWGEKLKSDGTYNPNLTLKKEDFSLAFPPRVG